MSDSTKSINNIRINDLLWFTVQNELISFRYKGLPEDVHFTVSFNSKSKYLNLHLTKNINGVPKEEKPKITILYVEKSVLNEVGNNIHLSVLSKFLFPLNVDEIKEAISNEAKFIPYDLLNESSLSTNATATVTESFSQISKVEKGTRLKIDGDLETKLLEIGTSETIQNLTSEFLVTLTEEILDNSNSGMIFHKEDTFGIIKIEGHWFRLKLGFPILELWQAVVEEPWATQIVDYIQSSIERISNATTRNDVIPFDNPIQLVKSSKLDLPTSNKDTINA